MEWAVDLGLILKLSPVHTIHILIIFSDLVPLICTVEFFVVE